MPSAVTVLFRSYSIIFHRRFNSISEIGFIKTCLKGHITVVIALSEAKLFIETNSKFILRMEFFIAQVEVSCVFIQVADTSGAMFGQCCFEVGDIKCTMGTGTFMALNTGQKPHASVAGLSTSAPSDYLQQLHFHLPLNSFSDFAIQFYHYHFYSLLHELYDCSTLVV